MDPTRLPQVPYGPRFGDGVRQEPLIERRTFMAMITGGLLAAPLAAEGQQAAKIARIDSLSAGSPYDARLQRFHEAFHTRHEGGHKTEAIYRRYAIVVESDLLAGGEKLDGLHQIQGLAKPTLVPFPKSH